MASKACGRRRLARSRGEQFVADLGPLGEPGVTRLLERRDVDEHVLSAAIGLDKSISLGWIKPLPPPHRHVRISSSKVDRANVIRRSNWRHARGEKRSL